MFHPRNLILIAVFLTIGFAASIDDKVAHIEKFFSKWKPNDEAIVTHDLLIERPRNGTEHLRSKRSIPISQDYPISLNSGATRCWIPGYTGAHCEFPICDQLNRHQHGEPTPAPVVLDYNYRRNATIPTWFNVDSSIGILIIKLDSDSANSPRAQLFDANGNEIGNYNDVFSTSPTETIYHYDRTGLPGGYMIQPFSMTDNTTALRTIISGISDIDLDIEMGFVPNYGDNQPERSDYPGKTPFKNTLNVVVADVKFLEIPGSLAAVTIYSQNSEVTVPSPLRIRYGCSYKYYFDSFYCRDIGQYYARFEGYDFFGYSFTRWTTFECLPAPETTPGPAVSSTPAPTNPTSCLNNGVLITRSDSSTYCYCQGLWAGKQCEIPLCANGGTITSNSNCLCANGWTGFHCELLYCNDDAGLGYELSDPMVLFVIRLRKSMGPVIAQIRDQIPILQANFSFNPEYFKHFAVAFFNNDVFQGVQDFRSVDQFINVLNVSSAVSDTSGTCSDSSYTALWELVNQIPISKKSPIYVFTDALPDDVDTYEESIYQKNSYRNAPINFIFVESDPVNCPVDQYDRRFRAMNRMAERSSGQVHYVQNANFGNTGNLFYNLVYGTYFKGHLVYIDDERTCANQPLYETISVDSNDRFWKLTFVVVGDNITVSLVSPDQDTSIQVPVTYQLGRSYVFSWVGLQTGTWTFSVVSGAANTPCNFRVWALEQPYQDSDKYLDYNLVWGATPAIVFDSWYREPVWQQPLHIVAHIENYPNATRPIVLYPEFVNAELTIHAQTDNGRQLVLASNGIWRSGCSMQLFFPITNTFTCQQPDQILYLTIYVRDPKGYMIQRAGVFYCNYIRTTIAPSPSPGTCEHQGVFYNNTCICPPDWTGDYCQTPICYNGGTVVGGAFCECPPGVGGRNCEWLRCTQSNPYPGFNTNRRSIAFLLDITKYNVGPLNNLARTIQQTISDIRNQQTEWIENFYVYAYNSQNVTLLISAQPYDEGGIVAAFDQAARLASNGDTGCHILTYQAILAAVPSLTKNSFIYVYQSALPDERDFDAVVNASYMVDQNRHMLMVYFAQDDATHVGPYPECNGRRDEYDILEEIALLSQGRLYNLRSSSFPDTLKLLPTMYSSGVVYGRVFEDCSSAQTVFAPLDSYAQSMQVIIGGGGGNITYTINRPNGQPVSSQFVGTYLNDQLNGWKVLDIRRGCDDDWENNNDPNLPYCFNIKGGQQNWTIARDYCWVAGAYLLDDSTIDLDNFTSVFGGDTTEFWIGLNDVNTTGTYFWDRGRHNPPATFNATAFSKWGPGQPVNDSVKQCVYRKGQWYVDDCGLKKNFICMKHKYSASFEPNNLDDYDLPAGRWAITVSGGTGRCNVEVRVQSPMQIFTGYTNDQHSDFPTFGPYSNSNDNRIVAHVPGFDPQATNNVPFLTNAQIYDLRNSTMYAAATYEYRVECQYQFLSQNWTCPNGNNRRNLFAVLHTGKDSRGVPFQRMVTGRCAQQRVCLNNGILYNGQCVCPEYFTGENCTTPICVNGGFLDPTKQNCICPKGYTGRACQYQTCVNPSNKTFSSDDKTFMLVLEKTQKNQAAITSLQSNLSSILLSLGSHWFTTWVIVTFDSTGVTYAKSATTQLDFEANFNASIASITDPGNCMLPIFSALLNATQVTPPAIGSVQYLVTAGAPSDNDIIVGYQNYFGALSQYQLKLYYILSKTSGTGACQQDPNEKHVNTLVDYAYGSDGDFIIIEQAHVGPHATAYLPTLGNATVLGNPTAQNFTCQSLTYYFEVDRHATQIYLSTLIPTAASKPTVIDYNGNPLSVDNLYSDTSSHFLYKATPNGEGIYTISLNDNSGPCLLQIRLQGGLRWTPGYVVAPAQMPNISWQLDNATNVPMGLQNAMVVHTGNDEVRLTYASFFNPFVGVRTLVSFYPRDPFACSYQWVSDVFDCQSRYLLIHIYGFDVHAQPFRRSGYTFCAAYIGTNNASTTAVVTQATQPQGTSQQTQPMQTTQPVTQVTQPVQTTQPVTQVTQPVQTTQPVVTQTAATTPTTTTTKYFGLNVDVIFLLDISTAVTQSQFNDMTNFFLNALGTFNIATGPNSPNGTRFAIIQVPGDNWLFPLYSASFETITSYNMLKTAFANAWPDPNFDPAQAPGQGLLPNATALTVSDNVINSGYRKNINNHLAIYVTTTSNATQAAITAATNIRQGGVYSFLSLAYQSNGANTASLTSYVGGGKCLYQAQDANSLNGFANQLAEQIFTASNNNGKYTCT